MHTIHKNQLIEPFTMNASFKEKSTWISLVATLLVFADYVWSVLYLSSASMSLEDQLALLKESLVSAIFLIILIEIVFQATLAISNRNSLEIAGDERDKTIENKSNALGYFLLAIGIIVLSAHIIYPAGLWHGPLPSFATEPEYFAHWLVSLFLLSEIIKMSYQIFLYRKDAL
jgi:uncharacterized membrane protein